MYLWIDIQLIPVTIDICFNVSFTLFALQKRYIYAETIVDGLYPPSIWGIFSLIRVKFLKSIDNWQQYLSKRSSVLIKIIDDSTLFFCSLEILFLGMPVTPQIFFRVNGVLNSESVVYIWCATHAFVNFVFFWFLIAVSNP